MILTQVCWQLYICRAINWLIIFISINGNTSDFKECQVWLTNTLNISMFEHLMFYSFDELVGVMDVDPNASHTKSKHTQTVLVIVGQRAVTDCVWERKLIKSMYWIKNQTKPITTRKKQQKMFHHCFCLQKFWNKIWIVTLLHFYRQFNPSCFKLFQLFSETKSSIVKHELMLQQRIMQTFYDVRTVKKKKKILQAIFSRSCSICFFRWVSSVLLFSLTVKVMVSRS